LKLATEPYQILEEGGKMWIRVFPDTKVRTKKGQDVPMGGGKGSLDTTYSR
jgi:ribosomal protein L16/L10AE